MPRVNILIVNVAFFPSSTLMLKHPCFTQADSIQQSVVIIVLTVFGTVQRFSEAGIRVSLALKNLKLVLHKALCNLSLGVLISPFIL